MAIIWTKEWAGSDDGTVLKAIDLKNIQDDLSTVMTVGDGLSIAGQLQGDLLYYNGTDWTRLVAGTSGQFLKTNGAGANPAWTDPVATDLTITSQATGDLLYYNGADWVGLTPGASGTVLTSNGAGAAPSYQALPTSETKFTSSGSWTCPAGITTAYVTLVGGGGGGGNAVGPSAGSGGGGGESYINYPLTVVPATVYTITIGGETTNSTFGALLTALAGTNGQDGGVTPGAGGGQIGSYLNATTTSGGGGGGIPGGNGAAAGGGTAGGGGGSAFGAGGDASAPGGNGTGYGAGGGGCSGATGEVGGNGTAGLCIVLY